MNNMFNNCFSLSSLNLSNFKINNVTFMKNIFTYLDNLTSLDLSNFNNKIRDMNGMFYNCSSLTSLNLSNFNANKFTTIWCMFYNINKCCNLICHDNQILNEFKK